MVYPLLGSVYALLYFQIEFYTYQIQMEIYTCVKVRAWDIVQGKNPILN